MKPLKTHLSQAAYLVLILAIAIGSGCTSINHQHIESSKILSIGNVQSVAYNKEKPVSLIASSKMEGYLTCFYQNKMKSSIRIYPNQYSEKAYIAENTIVNLSEKAPFKPTKTPDGLEKVACFLTQKNVTKKLPHPLIQANFSSYNISQIKTFFKKVTQDNYHYVEATL